MRSAIRSLGAVCLPVLSVVSLVLLAGTGLVVGSWVAGPPSAAVATSGETFCEDNACIEIKRRFWFDSKGCHHSPGTGSGCKETGDDEKCKNYDCGLPASPPQD